MVKMDKIKLSDGGIHLILKVIVDEMPLHFILDTGASHSVMDIIWAREHLKEDEIVFTKEPAHGIGSSMEVYKAILEKMEFGDLLMKKRGVALIDFSGINAVYKKEGYDEVQGILGGDILNDYNALIDYKKSTLAFDSIKENAFLNDHQE